MWETGILALFARMFSVIGTLMVGVLAGLAVIAAGTKALVIVPGILFTVVFVLIPFSGLYAIVATTPINVEIAGPITVSRLAILLGALAIYVQVAKRQIAVPRVAIWPDGTLAAAFFAMVAIATFGAGGGGYVGKLGPWIVFAVIFFTVLNYGSSHRQMHNLFVTLGVTGILQALLVLAEAFLGFSPFGGWHVELAKEYADGEVRVAGTSTHPIMLAGFFQVVLGCLGTLFFVSKSPVFRMLCIAAMLLSLMGWWYTFARSSWIGMLMMLFVAMLFASAVTRKIAVIGGLSGLAILTAFNFDPEAVIAFVESFNSISSGSNLSGVAAGSDSFNWRMENWYGAWNIFLQHPIFGVGIDESQGDMIANMPRGVVGHTFIPPEVPHNMFLHVASELGIFALILFIALWVVAVRGTFRAMQVPALRPYGIGLFAILVGQVTTFSLNPIPREIWLTLSMSFALGMAARDALVPAVRVPSVRARFA